MKDKEFYVICVCVFCFGIIVMVVDYQWRNNDWPYWSPDPIPIDCPEGECNCSIPYLVYQGPANTSGAMDYGECHELWNKWQRWKGPDYTHAFSPFHSRFKIVNRS